MRLLKFGLFLRCTVFLWCTVSACRTVAADCPCGIERWAVKTGADQGAAQIDLGHVVPTTIAALRDQPKPSSLAAAARVSDVERTVWSITAILVKVGREKDSDYHMVMRDGTHEMVVEIVDPCCVAAESPFKVKIAQARAAFDARYALPSSGWKTINTLVTVTGVGMFDRLHGQTGMAPNGLELHPVLSIEFNPAQIAPLVARELLQNGGFEEASSSGTTAPGWTISSTSPNANYVSTRGSYPHSGSRYAFMGGKNNSSGTLRQVVSIPEDATRAVLRFWVSIVTTEAEDAEGYDYLTVQITDAQISDTQTPDPQIPDQSGLPGAPAPSTDLRTSDLRTSKLALQNGDAFASGNRPGGYVQSTEIDLSALKGQTIEIILSAECDESNPTTFRIDDVSLLVES